MAEAQAIPTENNNVSDGAECDHVADIAEAEDTTEMAETENSGTTCVKDRNIEENETDKSECVDKVDNSDSPKLMADEDLSQTQCVVEDEDRREDKQDTVQQPVLVQVVNSLCLDMGRPSVARVRPRPRPRPRPRLVPGCGDTAEVFTFRHQRRGSLVIAGFK